MRNALALAACLAWGVSSTGRGTVHMDVLGGVWRDDFTDLSGLAVNQQGVTAAPTGFTIDSAMQTLTYPFGATGYSEAFASPGASIDPTLVVEDAGSSAEYLTLSSVRYDPGSQLSYPTECLSWSGETCRIILPQRWVSPRSRSWRN